MSTTKNRTVIETEYITVNKAAMILGISIAGAYKVIDRGRIPVYTVESHIAGKPTLVLSRKEVLDYGMSR